MLGPLPTLYRVVVCLCVLAGFIGLGAWLTFALPFPLLARTGAGIGAGVGAIVVLLVVNDDEPRRPRTQRVRVRSRR